MSHTNSSLASYIKSPYKTIKHSTYFDVYDSLFAKFVGMDITFVEVGILNGGSLFMWRDFFGKNVRIVGIDLNPVAKRWESYGFEIYIGSQSDPEFWNKVLKNIGKIDILLDDGGHTYRQQIITVESVLPFVKDDGLIVVEDTHTSYMHDFGAPSKHSFVEYAKNMVDGINYRFSEFSDKNSEKVVYGISFYESFVVFNVCRKKASKISKWVDNNGKDIQARDFRYADSKLVKALKGIIQLISWRYVPWSEKLISFIIRTAFIFSNSAQNRKLKKYFKY